MKPAMSQRITSLAALLLALLVIVSMEKNAAFIGSQLLLLRALIVGIVISCLLIAAAAFIPAFKKRPLKIITSIVLASCLGSVAYFYLYVSGTSSESILAQQLDSALITDKSSNGIIEVGFSYPIYTPTISVSNQGLYTRELSVYLRMTDANNEVALFRAVRTDIEGNALSVEASVRGMLSRNSGYLYSPLVIPPFTTVSGKVVFIISDLDDGTTFTEALGRAYQAQFELREPLSGELILAFPLDRI
ncbi:MAG: hypothetical protein COC19_08215 [SAR86 cluster bacterium]|uniref:Uncharacterized protein n=1 Tax=SAR86 cluster bacterium TaxID=2030880 RepID=A0A2A4MFA4_9GAMM|nr:MAG: hypothetical protein COC19_08215 [SAR86 cluster bacterium]